MAIDNIKLKAALIKIGAVALVLGYIVLRSPERLDSLQSIISLSTNIRALVVAPSGMLIRSAPSTDSRKIGSLPFLSYVDILEDNSSMQKIEKAEDRWYKVTTAAGEGWVWSGLIAPEGSPVYKSDVSPSRSDLELIKGLKIAYFADKAYIYDGLNSLAGVSGNSEWKVLKPSERVNGKKLMIVQALASYEKASFNKGTKSNSNIELMLAVDLENGQYEFLKANQDGKSLSKLEMIIMFGADNGLY